MLVAGVAYTDESDIWDVLLLSMSVGSGVKRVTVFFNAGEEFSFSSGVSVELFFSIDEVLALGFSPTEELLFSVDVSEVLSVKSPNELFFRIDFNGGVSVGVIVDVEVFMDSGGGELKM